MIAVLLIAILILVYVPSMTVRWVLKANSKPISGMPGTGGELAKYLLESRGLGDVKVEATEEGRDHYSPDERVVRLSPSNFEGRSITAVAVAAHEVGHAVQHAEGHPMMVLRQWLYPRVQVAERVAITFLGVAPVIGALVRSPTLTMVFLLAAIVLFLSRVAMHVVTLPVEWDASFGKAMPVIIRGQFIAPEEIPAARRVLRAAALTYVSSALADLLSFWRWFALLRGRGL